MTPTIAAPARVELFASDRPRRGEVWTFVDDEGRIVTHRFLRRLPDGRLRFQGDAVPWPDPPRAPEHLVGRVERVEDARGRRRVGRRRAVVVRRVVAHGLRRRLRAWRQRGSTIQPEGDGSAT